MEDEAKDAKEDFFLPDEESPELKDVHSFFDYRKWEYTFREMQDEIRNRLIDGTLGDVISVQGNAIKDEPGEWSHQLFEQLNDPYIDTNSSHFISFDPYLTYDKDTDGIYVVFDILDHEIDNRGSYYPLEYLNEKFCEGFEFQYENDIGLAIPVEKFVSMSLNEFQKTFENGAINLFQECLEKDKTFQKRHPVIQQIVEKHLESFKNYANHTDYQESTQSPTLEEVGPVLRCLYKYAEEGSRSDDDDVHMTFVEDDESSIQDFIHDINAPEIQSVEDIHQDIENDLQKFPQLKDVVAVGEDEAVVTCYGDFTKYFAAPKQEKVSDSLNLHDLMDPEKRKTAVQEMTKFFLKNGMDLNQMDEILSDVKMTALFQAVELEKKDPSLGVSKDSGR